MDLIHPALFKTSLELLDVIPITLMPAFTAAPTPSIESSKIMQSSSLS